MPTEDQEEEVDLKEALDAGQIAWDQIPTLMNGSTFVIRDAQTVTPVALPSEEKAPSK